MSPERLNNASRSAANDIWSIGATFVQMISGQPINHLDNITQFVTNVSQYKIFINGIPYNEFLQTLSEDDFKKKIISRTLCKESNRANCTELLSIVRPICPKLVRRIPKQTLIRAGEKDPNIYGMSYNSARDELFLADYDNKVVRAMRVRDNAGDLRDVYRAPHDTSPLRVECVPHERLGHTARVFGRIRAGREGANWLVALSRNGSEWREAQRVQTDGIGWISCALSDSRVLIGECDLHVYGAVPCGERPAHCARPPHPRARRVLLVLRDVRQRHARRDVIPESGQVGASASTARRPAGGTRAHPIEVALLYSCGSLIDSSSPIMTERRNRTPS